MKNINKNQNCHPLTNGLASTCHSLTSGITSTCHSLTSDSEEIRNLNQMPYLAHAQGMTEERGRSMVEMLGVLAVIGVLSVGGIAGYKTAMTKHKANELLNEASKRAVVVAAKIASGQFNASTALNEFESNTINGVTLSVTDNGDKTFSIKLSNMDKNTDVCEQITNMLGTDHINPTIEPNCAGLKYNNDLGSGTTSGSSGTGEENIVTVVDDEIEDKQECIGKGYSWYTPVDGTTGFCFHPVPDSAGDNCRANGNQWYDYEGNTYCLKDIPHTNQDDCLNKGHYYATIYELNFCTDSLKDLYLFCEFNNSGNGWYGCDGKLCECSTV